MRGITFSPEELEHIFYKPTFKEKKVVKNTIFSTKNTVKVVNMTHFGAVCSSCKTDQYITLYLQPLFIKDSKGHLMSTIEFVVGYTKRSKFSSVKPTSLIEFNKVVKKVTIMTLKG